MGIGTAGELDAVIIAAADAPPKRNKINVIKDIINELSANYGKTGVPIDEVYKVVETEGFDRETTADAIKKMK